MNDRVRPAGRFGRAVGSADRWISVLVLMLLWQAASVAHLVDPDTLAPPSAIAGTLWGMLRSGQLPYHLLVSLRRVLLGLGAALVVGGSLGLVAGLSRLGDKAVDAPMQMLRTIPFLGLIPLFILWFGIGELPKVTLVAVACTFPIYINLQAGVRGIDPKLIEAARVFGLRRAALIRHVVLPGALPSALVGLRYALGIAWLSLIGSEQVNATSGIGYLINDAREFFRTDIIMACLIVYALLGLASDLLVRVLEARLLAWRPAAFGAARSDRPPHPAGPDPRLRSRRSSWGGGLSTGGAASRTVSTTSLVDQVPP